MTEPDKLKPHKFKHGSNGTGTYDHLVFCEYCGLVVFYANKPNEKDRQYEKAKQGCPCAPERSNGGTDK